MNAPHAHHTRNGNSNGVDWVRQIKLALVLSVVAAVAALVLAGHVSDRSLVVGVIVVSSAIAWSRVEPLQPAHVATRRR